MEAERRSDRTAPFPRLERQNLIGELIAEVASEGGLRPPSEFEPQRKRVRQVVARLRWQGLRAKPTQCSLCLLADALTMDPWAHEDVRERHRLRAYEAVAMAFNILAHVLLTNRGVNGVSAQ